MTPPLPRADPLLEYERLLARLFELRALGPVPDDVEALAAEALNDFRAEMTEAEQEQIGGIIERMREVCR